MSTQTIPQSRAHGWAALLPFGSLDAFRAALKRYRLYRRTLAELSDLTDSELRDLGISRHDIRAIAHRGVYGA